MKEYVPRKPPMWIPDHLAISCMKCERDFNVFRRIHHCRNCGKCFCQGCSSYWMPIMQFGYSKPVRICGDCKVSILDEEMRLGYRKL